MAGPARPPTRDEMLAVVAGSGRRTPIAALCAEMSLVRGPRGTDDCRYELAPQHPLRPFPLPAASDYPPGGGDETDQGQGGWPRRASRHGGGLLSSAATEPLDRRYEEVVRDHVPGLDGVGPVDDGGGGDHGRHGGDGGLLEAGLLLVGRGLRGAVAVQCAAREERPGTEDRSERR